MKFTFEIGTYSLEFKRPAKTSRNTFENRKIHTITLTDQTGRKGTGEAAPLSILSIDDSEDYLQKLDYYCKALCEGNPLDSLDLDRWPSIRFGLETALLALNSENGVYFNNDFTQGKSSIPINGLVWMNEIESMTQEAFQKIESGFNCIKIKVGALDFDSECRLLEKIRKRYSAFDIELRLDANGGFHKDEAMEQLEELSKFEIHSIEQPIKPQQWDSMARLTHAKHIDIALDEELIGYPLNDAGKLLSDIQPQYIILKPNLIGGLANSDKWIKAALDRNIGWWATSALESNIGLNFISQWVASHQPSIHQGLGTGSLYSNNFDSPLLIDKGQMYFKL